MMKSTYAAVLLLVRCIIAQADSHGRSPVRTELDGYLTARTELGQFNGTALIAKGDSVMLLKGYGISDLFTGKRAEPDTRYLLASLSKSFTAAAVLKLEKLGKLRVGDRISQHLQPLPATWSEVTVDHLLQHSSGIADYEAHFEPGTQAYTQLMDDPNSVGRILAWAEQRPLDFAPGSDFNYCNTGYILLARIVEMVSGRTFEEYLLTEFLRPAGLSRTTCASDRSALDQLATGYDRIHNDPESVAGGMPLDAKNLAAVPRPVLNGAHGDACLVSNATDLLRWVRVLQGNMVLSNASRERMFTPNDAGYGYGWYVKGNAGYRIWSHTGALPGYISLVEYHEADSSTVILLSNTVGLRLNNIARDLFKILGGSPVDPPRRYSFIEPDTLLFNRLVGDYAFTETRMIRVTHDGSMLRVAVDGAFMAGAFPTTEYLIFYAPLLENWIRFDEERGGSPRRVTLRLPDGDLVGTRNE